MKPLWLPRNSWWVGDRLPAVLAIAALAVCLAASRTAQAQDQILTEWTVPSPLNVLTLGQIALPVGDHAVYFTESNGGKIGKLNMKTDAITEWMVSQPDGDAIPNGLTRMDERIFFTETQSSNPPASGSIVSSPAITGGIGSLDSDSDEVTAWITPGGAPFFPVHGERQLYFLESLSNRVGSLNPRTGGVREWDVPFPTLSWAGSGCISFIGGSGCGSFTGSGTGLFLVGAPSSTQTNTGQLACGIPSTIVNVLCLTGLDFDESGKNLWFTETIKHQISRLNLRSNTLTEWALPNGVDGSSLEVHVQEDAVYFTVGDSVVRLDPERNVISVWTVPGGTTCPPPTLGSPACIPTFLGDLSLTEAREGRHEFHEPARVYFSEPSIFLATPSGQTMTAPKIGGLVTDDAPRTDYFVAPVETVLAPVDSTATPTTWTATKSTTQISPVVTTIPAAHDGEFTFWTLQSGPSLLSKFPRGSLVFTEQLANKIGVFSGRGKAEDDDR